MVVGILYAPSGLIFHGPYPSHPPTLPLCQTWRGLPDRLLVASAGGPVPGQHPRVPLHPAARRPGVDQRRNRALGPGRGLVQQHRLERRPTQL